MRVSLTKTGYEQIYFVTSCRSEQYFQTEQNNMKRILSLLVLISSCPMAQKCLDISVSIMEKMETLETQRLHLKNVTSIKMITTRL